VGDALNTYSFEVLANAPFSDYTRVELIRELATNGGLNGMVLGQAIDCYFENKPLSIEDVKVLHTNKTAKLIAASLKMGAIIVDKADLADKLYDFGIRLGLLFQIQDDILDVTQSSQEAGKLTGNDEDKNSFVTLIGLEESMKEANTLADELEDELNSFDEKLQKNLSPLLIKYINRHRN
jgi:farnesyl diphosphate synthase